MEDGAAVLSGIVANPDSPGNPDTRHVAGGKHLDEQAAAPETLARKDRIEIPRAATRVPETLVQADGQADVLEPPVSGQGTEIENQRAPREIPDSEIRESRDEV